MESLAVLYRMYRDITGDVGGEWDRRCQRKLNSWLRDDVLPEIHKLAKRQRFREQARWPLDHLLGKSTSEERKLICEIDDLLVSSATKLNRIFAAPTFDERLAGRFEDDQPVEQSLVLQANSAPKLVEQKFAKHCRAREARGLMSQISSRFWSDLASAGDYFEPMVGWPTNKPNQSFPASFIVSLTPEVHSGGDYVSRCVILRVESLLRDVQQAIPIARAVFPELCPANKPPKKKWRAFEDEFFLAKNRARSLRHLLLENADQPLRDACILLTQIGAALSTDFDLTWLTASSIRQLSGIGYRLHRQKKELFDRIARALLVLRDFYAQQPTEMSVLDEAIAHGGLVVLLDQCAAIWQRDRIEVDWAGFRKEWQLLVRLAETARYDMSIGTDDEQLYPDRPERSTLPMLCMRLKSHLPPSLRQLILPAESGRYRLCLEGAKITVL